jgi:hypothetical protein
MKAARLGHLAAGQLAQVAAAELAQEHIAIAQEQRALPCRIEHRVGRIDAGEIGVVRQLCRRRAIEAHAVQIAQRAVGALQLEQRGLRRPATSAGSRPAARSRPGRP